MSRRAALILAAVLIISGAPAPKAQARFQQTESVPGGYRLKVNVNAVLLNVSARDRHTNRSIPNLRKEDFLVYDDGALQKVDQFAASDAPFSALLLIDNSGSTRTFLPLMKRAATDFTLLLKADDRVAVAAFNSLVELLQDFTDDRSRAGRAIGSISSIGGTAFYDALMTSIDIYMRGVTERSAIVVFTDGVDNQLEGENTEGSRTLFSQVYRKIQEIDPLIYTIFLDTDDPRLGRQSAGRPDLSPGVGWPFPVPRRPRRPAPGSTPPPGRPIYEKAREQLRAIADQTGGRMYSLTRAEDLEGAYREIAEDLKVQYVLSYTPNNHGRDGMWHDIRIQVRNRGDVAIRTRKGYYAQATREDPR